MSRKAPLTVATLLFAAFQAFAGMVMTGGTDVEIVVGEQPS